MQGKGERTPICCPQLLAEPVTGADALCSWARTTLRPPHLGHVLVFVPLSDDQELRQGLWVLVPDVVPHLPHQILLMFIELSVAPSLQDLLQLLLLPGEGTFRAQSESKGACPIRSMHQEKLQRLGPE